MKSRLIRRIHTVIFGATVLALGGISPCARADSYGVLFTNTFESEAVGGPPQGWVVGGTNANAQSYVTNNLSFQGSQSLYFWDNSAVAGEPTLYHPIPSQTNTTLIFQWAWYGVTAVSVTELHFENTAGTQFGPRLRLGWADYLVYNANGTWLNLMPMASNTWYYGQQTIRISSGLYDLTVSNASSGAVNQFTNLAVGTAGLTDLGRLYINAYPSTTGTFYFDNFSLQAIPEPGMVWLLSLGFGAAGVVRRLKHHQLK